MLTRRQFPGRKLSFHIYQSLPVKKTGEMVFARGRFRR